MIEELKLARLDGRSYEDIQPDVIKLVDYYVGIWYGNFPILKQYNYDSERIVTDVYHGIYLKTKDDGLSNLERHFIKASKIENCTMSYISNLIKNSVLNMLRCRARDVVRKPMLYSLDHAISENESGDITTLGDVVADPNADIEKLVEIKLALESIPNKKYSEYYYISGLGDRKKLSTRKILNWILSGYTQVEMRKKIFTKNNNNITSALMSELRKETINLAQKALEEFI